MHRTSAFKKTSDDWYPCYFLKGEENRHPQGFVEVSFHGDINPPSYGYATYRVSVWGADDLGMDFDTGVEEIAIDLYHQVIDTPIISREDLMTIGFNYF